MRAFFKAVATFLFILPIASQAQVATINGVPVSSISSIDGVPVSSIASINGLSLASGSGANTPSVVHSYATTSTSSTYTLGSSVTAGNILVVGMYNGSGTGESLTFSHTQGGSSAQLATTNLATDGDTVTVACATITSTGSDKLTFNASVRAVVFEVSNAVCTNDVTGITSNTTGSTSYAAGPMTTATANDLLIMVGGNDGTNTTATAAGSGWAGALNAYSGSSYFLFGAYQVVANVGSYSATSGTFSSEEQATILVALKP